MTVFNFQVPSASLTGLANLPISKDNLREEKSTRLKQNFSFEDAIKHVEENLKKGIRTLNG